MSYQDWEMVIGLEVHAQLLTQSKLFSGASAHFGAPPNTHVGEVELGLPGVLPVINERAVELAVRAGLALHCDVQEYSRFDRKNYFYPDLPKGYQISQFHHPICLGGYVEIQGEEGSRKIQLTRIHMEEDAGKSSHLSGEPYSLIDLNRAGVGLVEIVSEPEIRSADEAAAYMRELRNVLMYVGVCDGNMEEGSFRCDANVSVRPKGETELGTRAELKNINSFKFVRDAIGYEFRRQVDLLESGGTVLQETRLYNADRGVTYSMRSKEESHDYRYFPEPDLPAVHLDRQWIEEMFADLPELPSAKRARYVDELGLSDYDADVLTADIALVRYYEKALACGPSSAAKPLANWLLNEVLREAGNQLDSFVVEPPSLAKLVKLIQADTISGKIAKTVFDEMIKTGKDPEAIVADKGLKQVSDTSSLEPIVDRLVAENPDKVDDYRGGKTKMLGWFVGQVMKETRGKANPKLVNQLLREKLDA